MRRKYLEAVLRQDVNFFDTNTSTTATYQVVSTTSSDVDTIHDVLSEKIPNFLSNVTAFFSIIIVAFTLSWRQTMVTLPFTLLFIVPGVVYGKLLMEVAKEMGEAYGIAGGTAEQAISSIRTVVSYVGESRTLERFKQALERTTALGIKQGFIKGVVAGSMGMVYAVWAFQAWFASVLVTKTGAEGGNVFVSAICVNLGGLSIMSALPNIKYFSEAMTAASRLFEMIDRLPPPDSINGGGTTIEELRGEIEFKNVIFTYPSRPDSTVLCGLNLQVAAGQTIGLVGGSGSGANSLCNFYQREHTIWNEKASMELIVSAAKAANAHDFITKLPNGYDTHVGQFGFQMSGGQKQRIAIARALIRDPKILLLDEATSALDAQSERLMQDALDQAAVGRTTIIVAHRLTTLSRADMIAVLRMGKVVEFDAHDQLTQQYGEGGIYSRMVELQKAAVNGEVKQTKRSRSHSRTMSRVNSISSITPRSQEQSFVEEGDSRGLNQVYCKRSNPSQWRLMKLNKPEWKRGLLGCIGAVIYGAVPPIYSFNLGSVLSVYFLQDNELIRSKTRSYCFIFLSLAFITLAANIMQHYNFGIMGERLTKRVRETFLEKVLSFEIGWFDEDENSSAAICARLATETNMVRSLVGDRLSLILQSFTGILLAFILGLVITWRLAIVMIAIQPFVIASFYLRKVLMINMSKKAKKAQIEGSQLASEAVVNHRTITAFSSQKRMLALFEIAQEGPRKENIKQSWFSGLCLFLCQFILTATVALAFWYGGRLMARGLITSKHLFQAFFILMSMGRYIADAGSMTSDLAKGTDAVRSVLEILDRRSKIEPDDPEGIKEKTLIIGDIEFKNVSFYYTTRPEQIILNGLNLKIDAGKTVALVGQSGSGKSTIIRLIERFYDPSTGSVEIDGQNIKSYNLKYLRSHIALVSQEPTLFAGTIRDNISYGRESATENDIMNAAMLANAHEFISCMESGYETCCGERGIQLSGGQKQRIALARAILKDPAILLLDEATSALDSVSENLVQDALDKMMASRTCIIIAHRLSTIQKSDSIELIKNGRVKERGSHSDLLAVGHGGSYYELVKLQQDSSPHIQLTL
ncbi:ABC transporter B family member 15 [Cocos nucifera]|uniref:ABC transporter B family member 15 n=1 Tax=Cocos nucifera TaxID=13894 RepID=A0A8K0I0N9_COCNU|nr:ABC transporter B family member 15 [Cocos nucifera]